jgi:hypothetical protein
MSMLFAKINPAAEVPQNTSPFAYEVIMADYITASANPYTLGTTSVNFNVVYGTPTFDEEGNMLTFTRLTSGSVTLSDGQISQWGLDDSVVLTEICTVLGTTAVEFVEGNPSNFNPF